MTPKHYMGNYPNSANYDPNIPIGFNKWDAEEIEDRIPADDEQIEDENDADGNFEGEGI